MGARHVGDATRGALMVRQFSAAGPCLTLGRLYRQTDSYLYFQPVNTPCANPRRVLKCLPAHWSPHHTEPCPSCRDHPRTQYPGGYHD